MAGGSVTPMAPSVTPVDSASPVSVALVGSTGSIGTQTLDVVRANPGRFRIEAIAAHRSVDALVAQAWEFRPRIVAVGDDAALAAIRDRLPPGTELVGGADVYGDIAGVADVCVNGIVGFAGLPVTINALKNNRRLALANKESLITAGPVVRAVLDAAGPGAEIVPVDSEHCAIHQCLASHRFAAGLGGPDRLRRLVLTASGGPFRVRARDAGGGLAARAALAKVTRDEALAHPTWKMGPKITIDSSTLFNKGLEVIEAKELFDVDVDRIDVVVHPQSVVHSMAEFSDGTTMAQLSMPDMRLPIAYALAYPDRVDSAYGAIDWASLSQLDFEPPDREAFPCLDMAYEAGRRGGVVPAWVNAANEVAVAAFLDDGISWGDIFVVIEASLLRADSAKPLSVVDVVTADRTSRRLAEELCHTLSR